MSFGWMVANVDRVSLTTRGSGTRFPHTLGIFGGYPSPTRPIVILRGAGTREWLSKMDRVPENEIDLVSL